LKNIQTQLKVNHTIDLAQPFQPAIELRKSAFKDLAMTRILDGLQLLQNPPAGQLKRLPRLLQGGLFWRKSLFRFGLVCSSRLLLFHRFAFPAPRHDVDYRLPILGNPSGKSVPGWHYRAISGKIRIRVTWMGKDSPDHNLNCENDFCKPVIFSYGSLRRRACGESEGLTERIASTDRLSHSYTEEAVSRGV